MNASDIRILMPLGVISEAKDGMQTELNVVSINEGEIKFDLREWSLDHDKVGSGISFSNEEASVLFALMKQCFKDGGEGIDINSLNIPVPQMNVQPATEPVKVIDNTVCELLEISGIEYVDKREKGGALWVTGDKDLKPIMNELEVKGYKFTFSAKGGKQTKGQPGWYYREEK